MITLHELNTETQYLMQDFLFMERVNKTKSLLTAVGVLPTLRQQQHELLHNNFAALFVAAYDKGGDFALTHQQHGTRQVSRPRHTVGYSC